MPSVRMKDGAIDRAALDAGQFAMPASASIAHFHYFSSFTTFPPGAVRADAD